MARKIIPGGRGELIVRLVNAKTGDPYDLTGCTALTTCFLKDDGTELSLSLGSGITIVNALFGKIQIVLTAAQTMLLRPLTSGNLELAVTIPAYADPIKVQIPDAYEVPQGEC